MAAIIKGLGDGVDAIGKGVGNAVNGIGNAGKDLPLSLPPILPSLPPLPSPSGILPATGTNDTTTNSTNPLSSSNPLSLSVPSTPIIPPTNSSTPSLPVVTPPANTTLPFIDSDPGTSTVTSLSTVLDDAQPSASSTPSAPKSFLQNKPLAGAVFGLAGLAALVLIFVLATWAMRRRRRGRLMDEAISFEPTTQHGYADDMERLTEKASLGDGQSAGYSAGYGAGAGAGAAGAQYYGGHAGVGGGYNQQHPVGGAYPQFTLPSQSGY